MKSIRFVLGLAVPVVAIGAVRSKIRSERVPNAPDLATYLKLAYKPVLKSVSNKVVNGRYLDRVELNKGRFTQTDVNRILDKTWRYYEELAPTADAERLKTLGNRQNKLLAALTHAMYRALLHEGVEKGYATELVSDIMWKVFRIWAVPLGLVARLLTRDPQKQMALILRTYLRYPYSPPGYMSKASAENDVFALDIYSCPAYDYFKAHGEEEFALNSWCRQDFALAQVMTEGGSYERPHTLAAGDNVCDMRWYGRPRPKGSITTLREEN